MLTPFEAGFAVAYFLFICLVGVTWGMVDPFGAWDVRLGNAFLVLVVGGLFILGVGAICSLAVR